MSPERRGKERPEPCLECCLMAAMKGDRLDKQDLCCYCKGSRRCYHCVDGNHDCTPIQDAFLHQLGTGLFIAIGDYFANPSLRAASLVFFYQDFFLEIYEIAGKGEDNISEEEGDGDWFILE